jgi:hypothetical protein
MNELILELDKSGQLFELFKGGFISWTVLRDKDMFLTYQVHKQTGLNKTQSVKRTADQFDVSDNVVWVALRKMSAPINE